MGEYAGCVWRNLPKRVLAFSLFLSFPLHAFAQNSNVELAKQLANPVADLITVPVQTNWDRNIGIDDGSVVTVNIQPVIPISLNDDWLMVTRTIVPIVFQNDIPSHGFGETGLGDITESVFVSPKTTKSIGKNGQLIWAVGGALLIPTASKDVLGAGKWAAGPSGLAMVQDGAWSYGALANHVWSFAGDDDRSDVNLTYINPFVSYTTPSAITITPTADINYNWETDNWSIPVSLMFSKVYRVGKQPMSTAIGLKYWAESPDGGPEGVGARLTMNWLFPK